MTKLVLSEEKWEDKIVLGILKKMIFINVNIIVQGRVEEENKTVKRSIKNRKREK